MSGQMYGWSVVVIESEAVVVNFEDVDDDIILEGVARQVDEFGKNSDTNICKYYASSCCRINLWVILFYESKLKVNVFFFCKICF